MFPTTGTSYDPQRKIWSGPRIKDLYNIKMTVGEAVLRELRKNPQKIIQITDSTGEQLTAQEFMDYSRILAANLIRMDIGPKDILGLYAQNSTHVATVMMAAFLIGAPVNALYPEFDKENVKLLYKNTCPKIIFCDVENYQNAQDANEEMKLNATIVIMNAKADGALNIKDLLVSHNKEPLDSLVFPCVDMSGADTAAILCSSGTTGTPKGVMCSHHALLNKTLYLTIKSNSVLFCFSTMYWASGLLNLIASLLNSTLRIVTDQPYTPEYLLRLFKNYKITHLLTSSNQMAELIMNHDQEEIRKSLSSVDTLMCGGAKVPLTVQDALLNILSDNPNRPGLAIVYGMSELAGGVSFNAGYPFEFQRGTEGKLLPNKQVRIVDKSGQNLGPNESGEILVYSPYNWLGYFRNSEATAKAFSGEWLHTGDIGCIDDLGFLRVSGRDKDMFKYKGFQICPQLIEDAIMHVPGVAEVCVFPRPDFLTENVIASAIVRRNDASGRSLSKEMVLDYVSLNLDSLYHLRGGVYFVDLLPKTSSGKMQRQKVAELIMDNENSNKN